MTPTEQEAALKRVFAQLDEAKAQRDRLRAALVELVRVFAELDEVKAQRDRLRAALVDLLDEGPCLHVSRDPDCRVCCARAALEETK